VLAWAHETIALGSDEATELTDALRRSLERRGFSVRTFGALDASDEAEWPTVGRRVGEAVAQGVCASGIVCCWTGTGVSIAANKVPGVRAALCTDRETAAGAREWNDANVLALPLRATTVEQAEAILDAWFAGSPTSDARYRALIRRVESPNGHLEGFTTL